MKLELNTVTCMCRRHMLCDCPAVSVSSNHSTSHPAAISGRQTGSLHESQLANHGTVRLRSRRSLHEIVACLATSRVSVHQVALMPCSLAQRFQREEPTSLSVGLGSTSISNEVRDAMLRLHTNDACILGVRHCPCDELDAFK